MYNRTEEWLHFSDQVDRHIIHYTMKQYGNDQGSEQVDSFTLTDIKKNMERYLNRMERGARGPQEALRDCLKLAHYAQFAYTLIQRETQQKDLYQDEDRV